MFKKSVIFAAVIIVALAAASYFLLKARENRPAEVAPGAPVAEEPVRLTSPLDETSLPLVIKGEARGYWFFEAQFPIEVVSDSGAVISTGIASADGEWMTENYVPFTAVIKGGVTERTRAKIILRRNNPSGLEENAGQVSVPIVIIPYKAPEEAADTTTLKVYFSVEGEEDCSKVQYIERIIPKTQEVGKAAILELLKGPGGDDSKLFTSINPETKLNKVTIKNSVAYADFNSGLNKNIGGSCRVAAIRAQITETLKQFPTVKDVVISVNGKTAAILEP